MQNNKVVAGVAWCQREHWGRLNKIAVDCDEMDGSYEEWKGSANSTMNEICSVGKTAQRVNVDINE